MLKLIIFYVILSVLSLYLLVFLQVFYVSTHYFCNKLNTVNYISLKEKKSWEK